MASAIEFELWEFHKVVPYWVSDKYHEIACVRKQIRDATIIHLQTLPKCATFALMEKPNSILQCPSPAEHAAVLIEVEHGDLVAAWSLALNNRMYARGTELQDYWFLVAEAIAAQRDNVHDALFLRGHKFDA
jgi:hypothetical protein